MDLPHLDLETGVRVVLWPAVSCGTCSFCRHGREKFCHGLKLFGCHLNGGFAEAVALDGLVPEQLRVFRIPGNMSDQEAVFAEPLGCVLNAFGLVGRSPGSLLILGAGLMGRLAARYRSHFGENPSRTLKRS